MYICIQGTRPNNKSSREAAVAMLQQQKLCTRNCILQYYNNKITKQKLEKNFSEKPFLLRDWHWNPILQFLDLYFLCSDDPEIALCVQNYWEVHTDHGAWEFVSITVPSAAVDCNLLVLIVLSWAQSIWSAPDTSRALADTDNLTRNESLSEWVIFVTTKSG